MWLHLTSNTISYYVSVSFWKKIQTRPLSRHPHRKAFLKANVHSSIHETIPKPAIPHSLLRTPRKSSEAESQSEDGQTCKMGMKSESRPPSPCTAPSPTSARHQERKTPNAKQSTRLIWSRDQTNKPGWSKNSTYPSWQQGLVANIDVSRQAHHKTDISRQPNSWSSRMQCFHSVFFLHRTKKKKDIATHQKVKFGVRNFLEDGQISSQRTTLFIDGEVIPFPIRFLKFPRSQSTFQDFRHVKSAVPRFSACRIS